MEIYQDLNGNSGVSAFELGPGYIRVRFSQGTEYLYTAESAGAQHIAAMQQLAVDGRGLSTYISKCVKNNYEAKSSY